MKKLCFIIFLLTSPLMFSQEVDKPIHVHFYTHTLSSQNILQDGTDGKNLEIREDTIFIWIDLFPGMTCSQKFVYILVSKENIRVERENSWPILNGKMIPQNQYDKFSLISTCDLPLVSKGIFSDEKITIRVYPQEFIFQKYLVDDPMENLYSMDNNFILTFDKGAFFAHPRAYILVSRENIFFEHIINPISY